jgi:hypothetical protein
MSLSLSLVGASATALATPAPVKSVSARTASHPRCEDRHPAAAWRSVRRWVRTNAPAEYRLLHRGATPRQLRRLRQAIQAPIPRALVEWLRMNDGTSYRSALFPYDEYFLSARQVAVNYRIDRSVNTRHYTAWPKRWVPVLLAVDGSQDYAIGKGSGAHCLWDYDFEDGPPGFYDSAGITTLLRQLHRWMVRGRTPDGWVLSISHGRMHWNPED